MRFTKGHILTSSRSKEAAAGLEPAIKVITIGKSWWKLLLKNATFMHDIKCPKSTCLSYLGLMIPEHTALMTLQQNTVLHEMYFPVIITYDD